MNAQENILRAQIVDMSTGEGIGGATISISTRVATISDTLGNFSIPVKKYPVKLTMSHLSYGVQDFTINYHPEVELVFKLSKVITRIQEIMISGEKLQELTKGVDYSIKALEFDDTYMWQIGMVNNRPGKCRLILSNLVGDTLHSIPIKNQAYLRKDLFNNVHLQTEDSIFQLYGQNDSIYLFHGEEVEAYDKLMEGYQAALGPGLVFLVADTARFESYLYYLDSSLNQPKIIQTFEEKVNDHSWLPDALKQMERIMGPRTVQQILDQQRVYFKANQPESLFKLKDSLYIVDLNNDKLHTVGPDLKLKRSVPITFFHKPNPRVDDLFVNYDYLMTDPVSSRVYVTYHNNNIWKFVPLDPLTGKTGPELQVPSYPAMNNIRFYGGAIYYIYPEKAYPFFNRIFRMVVD